MMRSMISAAVLTAAMMAGAAPALAQYPAQAVAYSVEPFTPQSQITINGAGVRLRAEPFTNPPAQVLSSGSTGLPLNVIGIARLPDWNWYQVILKSGQKAFIRSDYTSAPSRGAGTAVAAAQAVTPPAYTAPTAPAPTATPQPYAAAPAPAPAPLPSATRVENSPASSPFASTPAYTGAPPSTTSAPIAIAPSTAPVAVAPAPATTVPVATPPVSAPVSAPYTATPAPSAASSGAPISLTPRSAAPAIPVPAPTEPSYPSGLLSKPPG